MDELIGTVTSLAWWFGVVGVSFAINLLSAYAKSPIDTILSGVSLRWQKRSERTRSIREAKIKMLRSNPRLQAIFLAREQRRRNEEIVWLLFAVVFTILLIGTKILDRLKIETNDPLAAPIFFYFLTGFVALSIIFALGSHLSAVSYMLLIEEAEFGKTTRKL